MFMVMAVVVMAIMVMGNNGLVAFEWRFKIYHFNFKY